MADSLKRVGERASVVDGEVPGEWERMKRKGGVTDGTGTASEEAWDLQPGGRGRALDWGRATSSRSICGREKARRRDAELSGSIMNLSGL